jgi:NADH dehydrogenase
MALEAGDGKRIAVIGGGAGGLELAIRLARLTRPGRRARVTLIDRLPTHVWKPRWHEIAVGLLVEAEEAASYAAQAARHGFEFVLGEVTGLDPERRRLSLSATPYPVDDPVAHAAGDDLLPARTLAYDQAVLAIGSTVNDFDTPGVHEHCYTLDTAAGSERLHRALLAQGARVKAGVQGELRVVIVGAGTTGVELAAELRNAAGRLPELRSLLRPHQLSLTLLEMADRPLPGSPPGVSAYARDMLGAHRVDMRFKAKVVRVTADAVEMEGGESAPADLVVWASGVKARRLATPLEGVSLGKNGRTEVDAQLRALSADGSAVEGLHVIGDCAAAPMDDGDVVPATAQAAHQQAAFLARSLARQLRGRPALEFRYRYKGTLVSLGKGSAVGDLPTPSQSGQLKVSGFGAKLAYAALYEAHLAELYGVWRTGALALSGALRRSAQPAVKLFW